MDIGSKSGYPSSALSNFAGHRFQIDGVECYSMEGFLQSLKFKEPEIQKEVCKLIGKKAKFRGKPKKWWRTQTLYWQGVEIKRDSVEYQYLLDRAFQAMYDQSKTFRSALEASGKATLTHSMGKNKISETVLTNTEFCGRLTRLRDNGVLDVPGIDGKVINIVLTEKF
jgi:hypothetical protein